MERSIDISGHAAIEYLVCRFGGALAQLWDGTLERVGFIVHNGDDKQARVGFWSRQEAPVALRALAHHHAREAQDLRKAADHIASRPRPEGLQCVLLGPDMVVTLEINPEDLRTGNRSGFTGNDFADAFDACSTQRGAEEALGAVQLMFRAEGVELGELDRLATVVAKRWEDVSAIAVATAKAREAADAHLPTPAGQRCRLLLNMLSEATANRQGAGVNARGGSS